MSLVDKKSTIHLFFEQSGTFKNEFKKLGYKALDYDILNDFGETNKVIDLFNQIELSFNGGGRYLTLSKRMTWLWLSSLVSSLKTNNSYILGAIAHNKRIGLMNTNLHTTYVNTKNYTNFIA